MSASLMDGFRWHEAPVDTQRDLLRAFGEVERLVWTGLLETHNSMQFETYRRMLGQDLEEKAYKAMQTAYEAGIARGLTIAASAVAERAKEEIFEK